MVEGTMATLTSELEDPLCRRAVSFIMMTLMSKLDEFFEVRTLLAHTAKRARACW